MIRAKSSFLSENPDFGKFLNMISDNTGTRFNKIWNDHVTKNLDLWKKTGWACSHLQDCEKGKAAVMMGSSPAIGRQIGLLRELSSDEDFVLCALSSNLKFILENDIKPKYAIVCDADPSTGKDWEGLDMDLTSGITLLASTVAYPPMLTRWKGPLYFFALGESDKGLQKKYKKWYRAMNGNGEPFPSLMGQSNVMTAFSFLVLGCSIILFVGNELSFAGDGATYYVDRADPRDKDKKYPHGDIHGNIVYTTPSLYALKLSLEAFLELISKAGWFINCTEAGIFGISKRFPDLHVPWIQQLTLKNGIAQARQIMRSGQPLYAS